MVTLANVEVIGESVQERQQSAHFVLGERGVPFDLNRFTECGECCRTIAYRE